MFHFLHQRNSYFSYCSSYKRAVMRASYDIMNLKRKFGPKLSHITVMYLCTAVCTKSLSWSCHFFTHKYLSTQQYKAWGGRPQLYKTFEIVIWWLNIIRSGFEEERGNEKSSSKILRSTFPKMKVAPKVSINSCWFNQPQEGETI